MNDPGYSTYDGYEGGYMTATYQTVGAVYADDPLFGAMPDLLMGGVAVALVALAQAAGISAAVPNPDGSRPNMSRDFFAQSHAVTQRNVLVLIAPQN